MEKLKLVHTDGTDYIFAFHSDEVHMFTVGQGETYTIEKFESASLMDDEYWKSFERFLKGNPIEAYFNNNSVVIAEITEKGLSILDEDLYQERKAFHLAHK